MILSDYLTIVIPCKNESKNIDKSLTLLNYQKNINNVKVIVADSSTDYTKEELKERNNDKFNLLIVDGGLPSKARNNGIKYVTTPYVLFMDSDMFVLDSTLLIDMVMIMENEKFDLLTTKIRTTNGRFNYVFKTFDFIQISTKYFSPFSLGGFMLFNKDVFEKLGGFDEEVKVAEDYLLSKQIKPKKFKIVDRTIFTLPRRFDNKGLYYMVKLMIQSFFNRNDKTFFSNHKTYWK
jgi:glycosyltransferase involved in cell wall biosynthesis